MGRYVNRSKTGMTRVADSYGKFHTVKDETGETYGELFVIRLIGLFDSKTYWFCRCSCGKECEVSGSALRANKGAATISCGHVRAENGRRALSAYVAGRCGADHPKFKHGLRCKGVPRREHRQWQKQQRDMAA